MQPLTIPAPKEAAAIITLTPAMARQLLTGNVHNRNVRERHVQALARDIRNGRWRLSGDSIKRAHDGTIIDGQHRLLAVVEADMPIEVVLVTNVDPDAQIVVDTGRGRTFPDTLRLMGEGQANDKAALVRKIVLWESDSLRTNLLEISRQELLDAYMERKDDIDEAVRHAARVYMRGEVHCTRSVLGLAIHNLMKVDSADAAWFFDRLSDGQGLMEGDPIYTLRRVLRNRTATSNAGGDAWVLMGMFYKTWNAYRRGEKIRNLMFRAGGANPEQMPELV